MKTILTILLHTTLLCVLMPGTLNARYLCYTGGGLPGGQGQNPSTILPRRSRHYQHVHRVPRCQIIIGMMPPDDEKDARRIRRAKYFISTISQADQTKASLALAWLALPHVPGTPLYQSLCSLLI